jgi:predicted DNA-binding protein (UPF0251 family)
MMLIPAHREVMNLVYYQDKSIEEVAKIVPSRQTLSRCACSTRRQLAELLRKARVDGLIVQREIPRTPIRDLMEGNSFSPQTEFGGR